MTPKHPHGAPRKTGEGRRWRRADCVGQCVSTGSARHGGIVHLTRNGDVLDADAWSRGASRYWRGPLRSSDTAKRAVERWLARHTTGPKARKGRR